ncbi:TPA: aldehyde dehydrogenase family protein [Pseudomonas putida]
MIRTPWSNRPNDVLYGLASGIYTSKLANAMKTAVLLEAGNVWINQYFNLNSRAPFGGLKESGIGREYCHDTLNQDSHVKTITVQTQVNQPWFAL